MILYNNIYADLDELLTGRPLKIAQNLSAKIFQRELCTLNLDYGTLNIMTTIPLNSDLK